MISTLEGNTAIVLEPLYRATHDKLQSLAFQRFGRIQPTRPCHPFIAVIISRHCRYFHRRDDNSHKLLILCRSVVCLAMQDFHGHDHNSGRKKLGKNDILILCLLFCVPSVLLAENNFSFLGTRLQKMSIFLPPGKRRTSPGQFLIFILFFSKRVLSIFIEDKYANGNSGEEST